MNTEIQTFNFNTAPLRTLTDENGDPWFVGKDVATILGYTNPRKALIDHVDDEDKTDGVTIRDSIGREQNPTIINKSGMYPLILSSKLPTAKHCTAGHLVTVMSTKHGTKADGTKFAFPPTVRITRKGLAPLHKRLGETIPADTLEATTH